MPAFSSTGAPLRHLDPAAIAALPKNPTGYAHAKAVANARYAMWAQRHGITTKALAPSPDTAVSGSLNKPGLAAADQAFAPTPPDTTGAIGPSNYVEMVNSEVGVYSNTDLSTPSATLDQATFVGDPFASTCDGQIQWDQEGQRWLYAALNCGASSGAENLYYGWSKTTSPTPLGSSGWCQFQIATGSTLADYPKLGHDDTQLIIGTNGFDDSTQSYTGSQIFVVPKPTPGTITSCGSAPTPVTLDVPDAFTPVPANLADSSADGYVVANDINSSSVLDLYEITPSATSGTMSPTDPIVVPSYSMPAAVPQPGTTDTLDSLDGRLTQAVGVKVFGGSEHIWTQHTVGGRSGGPSVVRWYELDPFSRTPVQTGTVSGPNGAFAFNGAISPSKDGQNAAIFYNTGSSTQLPDFRVEDRHGVTTPGEMIEGMQLATSSAEDSDFSCPSQGGGSVCRWGDYNGASPDPSNAALVWGTGELTVASGGGGAQWGSENAAIDVTPAADYTLNVATAGSGSVTSGDSQISCPSTCSHTYPYDTSVTLTATPAAHYEFSGWSGDCTGVGPCGVPMGGPQSVTATFTLEDVWLSMTESGTGSGTVTSSPSGINCSSFGSSPGFQCAYPWGTTVTLSATPATGSMFTGWSGACSGTGTCNVTMNQAQSVTATFALVPETLTVSKSGAGSGTVASTVSGISCGSTCSHAFDYGTTVTLTATAGANSVFTGWLGACTGTGSCTVPMTAAQSVTATFGLVQETLTVTRSGKGKVVSTPAGTSCGSGCALFYYGTSVALTATPAPGYKFAGWKGACTGPGACTVSMTAATSVTAKFTKIVCVVPKVKGKKLAAAKRAITAAHCSVGTVKKKKSTTGQKGKVVSQKPKPGKHLSKGAPVNLVVGKGK